MSNEERQTGIMEGTEGVLEEVNDLEVLTDDDLDDVTGGVTLRPFANAVGTPVYALYNGKWWPGVIILATTGNPPLYTVEGYNNKGGKWTLVCTINEMKRR